MKPTATLKIAKRAEWRFAAMSGALATLLFATVAPLCAQELPQHPTPTVELTASATYLQERAPQQTSSSGALVTLTLKHAIELALQNSKDIQLAKIQTGAGGPFRSDYQGAILAECLCGFRRRVHFRNSRNPGWPGAIHLQPHLHARGFQRTVAWSGQGTTRAGQRATRGPG